MRMNSAARKQQSGQGMLEYILIVVFVAVAGIVIWRTFGQTVKETVTESNKVIGEETSEILNQAQEDADKSR